MPNNIPGNRLFCSFYSFLIVWLTPFIDKPDSSRDLTIFVMSFISSFKNINVVLLAKSQGRAPDPNIFL